MNLQAHKPGTKRSAASVHILTVGASGSARLGITTLSGALISQGGLKLALELNHSDVAHAFVRRHMRFCINVLAVSHRSLAERFLIRPGMNGVQRFENEEWTMGGSGELVVTGAVAVFDFQVLAEDERLSHSVFVASGTLMGRRAGIEPLTLRQGMLEAGTRAIRGAAVQAWPEESVIPDHRHRDAPSSDDHTPTGFPLAAFASDFTAVTMGAR
jgi:flavin reductase (DIM6/NTAB) family NADH-FMN oxidoreductase RutF